MGVERILNSRIDRGDSGQSILEFLLMLPLLAGFTLIMLRVNTTIQMSIVNQQYARAQALFIAQNSSYYPRLDHLGLDHDDGLYGTKSNQLIIGVSENGRQADDDSEDPGETFTPVAAKHIIARSVRRAGPKTLDPDSKRQGYVRIRTTVSLCAPSRIIQTANGKFDRLSAGTLGENTTATVFAYCRSGQLGMEP